MTTVELWELGARARAKVDAESPARKKVLVMFAGECPSGPTENMDEITHWRVVFNEDIAPVPDRPRSEEPDLGSFEVTGRTDTGELGEVVFHEAPFLENAPLTDVVTMSPVEAYKILRDKAGVTDGFQWVYLHHPVAEDHVQYRFTYDKSGRQGWSVHVDDREVKPLG
ncbi:hypothetical protein AB0D45_32410 [Streptomyces sp. NPDC048352]|uniref:hypothetical protein n=1 Tax=Streptomyces sp. NPDC048352 TaxID=3154718 RepID=UPI00343D2934